MKDRQEENKANWDTSKLGFWDRKRPRYLFSGLMKCGICGGGIVNINSERVGCANARNKGTCESRQTLRRETLEATVLDGLRNELMEPDLFAIFCEEYTRHMNALRIDASSSLEGYRAELSKVTRDIDRVIQAILDGVHGAQVKDKMAALEGRKTELEKLIGTSDEPPALLHPNMADHYHREVAELHAALADEKRRKEAVEIIRALIEKIVLTPVKKEGRKTMAIDLNGHMAGILSLAAKTKKPPHKDGDFKESTKVVAGAGCHLYRTSVKC